MPALFFHSLQHLIWVISNSLQPGPVYISLCAYAFELLEDLAVPRALFFNQFPQLRVLRRERVSLSNNLVQGRQRRIGSRAVGGEDRFDSQRVGRRIWFGVGVDGGGCVRRLAVHGDDGVLDDGGNSELVGGEDKADHNRLMCKLIYFLRRSR